MERHVVFLDLHCRYCGKKKTPTNLFGIKSKEINYRSEVFNDIFRDDTPIIPKPGFRFCKSCKKMLVDVVSKTSRPEKQQMRIKELQEKMFTFRQHMPIGCEICSQHTTVASVSASPGPSAASASATGPVPSAASASATGPGPSAASALGPGPSVQSAAESSQLQQQTFQSVAGAGHRSLYPEIEDPTAPDPSPTPPPRYESLDATTPIYEEPPNVSFQSLDDTPQQFGTPTKYAKRKLKFTLNILYFYNSSYKQTTNNTRGKISQIIQR